MADAKRRSGQSEGDEKKSEGDEKESEGDEKKERREKELPPLF
jgi:hypothetical protein